MLISGLTFRIQTVIFSQISLQINIRLDSLSRLKVSLTFETFFILSTADEKSWKRAYSIRWRNLYE